jgi:excisionase family DNA binding protein
VTRAGSREPAPPPRRHQLATVAEAAQYISVNPKTVRRWINQGRLTGYAAGPRLIRVDLDEVDAMLSAGR